MPCDQYELQLQNSVVDPDGDLLLPVARLKRETSKVLALQRGYTNIVLDHKSIHETFGSNCWVFVTSTNNDYLLFVWVSLPIAVTDCIDRLTYF